MATLGDYEGVSFNVRWRGAMSNDTHLNQEPIFTENCVRFFFSLYFFTSNYSGNFLFHAQTSELSFKAL